MKTIGLIGGMSWESTVTYYQIINKEINNLLGDLHSAKCILYSVDFQEIEEYQSKDLWDKSAEVLATAAQILENGGADFIVLCTNTMHKVSKQIQDSISIPFTHIAECTADVLIKDKIKKVGLLGTKYTMEQDFYKSVLIQKGIEVVTPTAEDIEVVNDIIFKELCKGIITEQSKNTYLEIIKRLANDGAEGVILGCTEIGMLIEQSGTNVTLYDTTKIHAKTAAQMALAK